MMRPTPTVSVAMATYNGARFLQAQLDSLAAQTLRPAELVVGDDGSTDATMEIAEAFAADAPFPVRLHRNETRLDYGENFMRAAMRCTGDYVAFCDQDDVWLPRKLELCVEALERHGAALCAHDAHIVDAQLRKTGYFSAREQPGPHPPLTIKPWGVFFGFTLVVRRELLDLISPAERPNDNFRPGKKLAHDRWAYFLGATLGSTVYLREPLALYRQHEANTFGAMESMSVSMLRERVHIAAAEQAMQVETSRQKAAVLDRLAARAQGETSSRARAGAAYWSRMAQIYEQRGKVATAQALGARLKAIGGLIADGGYASPARGGLSARALAKDLLVAFARRPGEQPQP